jgi:glutathionylspermidine synthase
VKEQEQVDGKTALLQQWLINYQNADTPAKDSNFNVTQEDIEARASLCWRSGDNTRCHASGIKTGQEELFKPPAQEAEPAAQ